MAHESGMMITPKVLHAAAGAAVLVSLLAWAVEWSGMAYVCPYCRVQRTVIGVLGLLTLFARPGSLIVPCRTQPVASRSWSQRCSTSTAGSAFPPVISVSTRSGTSIRGCCPAARC
ncbi:exported hypothetical protein [Stenotrophomonas thermophila]|nr:exported hypothetical protein [Stenotrophomonas maltophilia]